MSLESKFESVQHLKSPYTWKRKPPEFYVSFFTLSRDFEIIYNGTRLYTGTGNDKYAQNCVDIMNIAFNAGLSECVMALTLDESY